MEVKQQNKKNIIKIIFINSLKIGEVTTWRNLNLYKTIVGDEIRPSTLSRQAKDIVGSDIT